MDPVWYSDKVQLNLNNTLNNITKSLNRPPPSLEALRPTLQWALITLYSATAIISFCSHITVILVLYYGKKSSRELKKFLINLSLSDVCMSLCSIPFTYTDFMLGRWVFHPFLCPLASFATIMALFVSVYTLIVIGIDRYYAILHPLRQSGFTETKGIIILIMIWLFGAIISSPNMIITRVEPFKYGKNLYYDCRELWSGIGAEIYSTTLFLFTFALPLFGLIFIYGSIGYKILTRKPIGETQQFANARSVASIKAIKMMSMVVILFAICWTPIQMFNFVIWLFGKSLKTRTQFQMNLYVSSFFLCHWLAMAHSLVNPFIYCFMSDNFRSDLASFCTRIRRKKRYNSNHRSSTRFTSKSWESTAQTFEL